MWSPLAEEVVVSLIARLPAEQLDPARTHAARLNALPIGCDMWSDYYLRPNGEVVIVGADLDLPDLDSVETNPGRVLAALVWGSRRYPELRQLLPQREPGAADCLCCRHPELFGAGKIICQNCAGLGWVPPTFTQD